MLFTVYDKAGEPFEVRPDRAKALVIEQGWSLENPATPEDLPLFKEVDTIVAVADPAPTAV